MSRVFNTCIVFLVLILWLCNTSTSSRSRTRTHTRYTDTVCIGYVYTVSVPIANILKSRCVQDTLCNLALWNECKGRKSYYQCNQLSPIPPRKKIDVD